jgi:hypothetical protein
MKKATPVLPSLSNAEKQAIESAVAILRYSALDGITDDQFKKAESVLRHWLQKAKSPGSSKRHGNATQFKKYYLPLVKKLHDQNPTQTWTYKHLAEMLDLLAQVELVEPAGKEAKKNSKEKGKGKDKKKLISLEVLTKKKIPEYKSLLEEIGLKFGTGADLKGSAKLPAP